MWIKVAKAPPFFAFSQTHGNDSMGGMVSAGRNSRKQLISENYGFVSTLFEFRSQNAHDDFVMIFSISVNSLPQPSFNFKTTLDIR